MNNTLKITAEETRAETQRFFVKVYGWMSLVLILTALVAVWIRIKCRSDQIDYWE